ncbi:TlpA family protein disulfide reductase [Archangium violaceum]|uniref:Thioredoxin domain-containing protein n=1 Tax=Archangium violaceum Cb vi76 TaxID=1406225 RepID=A0A084SFV9_9BACT|nr:TlpA disulfide reductase family protein [Archangium violaceum]KFA87344.1 hypothetical protein Q664_48800 [Archangium violaceum Cb vi76]
MSLARYLALVVVLLGFRVFAQPAPAFDKKGLDGSRYMLSSLSGKIVVLNFWFKDCGACRYERKALNSVVGRYQPVGDVVFIGFSLDDRDELKAFLRKNPFRYAVVPDAHDVALDYGVSGYPTHVIIGRDGEIAERWTGANDAFERLTAAIDTLREQGEPAPDASSSSAQVHADPGVTQDILISPERPMRGATVKIYYAPKATAMRQASEIQVIWKVQANGSSSQGVAPMRKRGDLLACELKIPEDAMRLSVRLLSRGEEVIEERVLSIFEASDE